MPICVSCPNDRSLNKNGQCVVCVKMRVAIPNSSAVLVAPTHAVSQEEKRDEKKLANLRRIRAKIMSSLEAESSSPPHASTVLCVPCIYQKLNLFTVEYWKRQVSDEVYAEAQTGKFWQSYGDQKHYPARTMAEVARLWPILETQLKMVAKFQTVKLFRNMDPAEATNIEKWQPNRVEAEMTANLYAKALASESSASALPQGGVSPKEYLDLLRSYVIPTKNHLGDLEQCAAYTEAKARTEFTLKPGAHLLMFTPMYMSILRNGKGAAPLVAATAQSSTTFLNALSLYGNNSDSSMASTAASSSFSASSSASAISAPEAKKITQNKLKKAAPEAKAHPTAENDVFPAAAAGEGILAGYLGVKSESDDRISLSIGNSDASALLFQFFVASTQLHLLNASSGSSSGGESSSSAVGSNADNSWADSSSRGANSSGDSSSSADNGGSISGGSSSSGSKANSEQ